MTAISCEPKPVYFNLDENGVINVHPAIVREAFGHCTTKVVLTFSEEKELKKKVHSVSLYLFTEKISKYLVGNVIDFEFFFNKLK